MQVRNALAFVAICLIAACNNTKNTPSTKPSGGSQLNGTWELNYISNPGKAFDVLYPTKRPTLTFDIANNKVSGNSGCNNLNGPLKVDGNKIDFTQQMAMTRMMCPGDGEILFMKTLKSVNVWSVSNGNTLNLIMGDIAVMRFTKRM